MPDPSGGALTRLATYGTLAPGRQNYSQVAGVRGRWLTGHVRGTLVDRGWGAALGFPALVLAPDGTSGDDVAVHVLESAELPAHWDRLDTFEGPGYRRAVAPVRTADGVLHASVYVLADT